MRYTTSHHIDKRGTETKQWTSGERQPRPGGESFLRIVCPWCGTRTRVPIKELAKLEKHCDGTDCGALFGSAKRAWRRGGAKP